MKDSIIMEEGKKYQWNPNFNNPIAYVDINKVVQELLDIENVHGKLTPQLIVESSKNKKSVLHNYFEWDNNKAAEKYRLRQASQLLTRIEVKTISEGETRVLKAFEITKMQDGLNKTPAIYNSKGDEFFVIKTSLEDLKRIRNRLHGHKIDAPLALIDQSIQILSNILNEKTKDEAGSGSIGMGRMR